MTRAFKPGLWKHFKGGLYFAIAEAQTVEYSNSDNEFCSARYCEDASIEVIVSSDWKGNLKLQGNIPKGLYVLYEQLYESDFPKYSKWVRSLEDWLSMKKIDDKEVERFAHLNSFNQPGTGSR